MTALHRLDEVCDVVMGQAPSGDAYNGDGKGWPLIAGAGDFGDVFPVAKKYTTKASKLSRPGDIILGIRASIGDKVLSDGVYCLGRGVAALRPHKEVDPRYLWHWLTVSSGALVAKARGATFKQVNREDIGALPISVPPLAEQRVIADVLDHVDKLKATRNLSIALIEPLTESMFNEMFGDSATGSAGPWEPLALSLSFVTSGSRGWARYYGDSGARFVRSIDVRMNRISDDAAVYVNAPNSAEARRTQIEAGDVLLTITGSRIGRVASAPQHLKGAYISQHVAILRLDRQRMDPDFLAFFLSLGSGGQRQIAQAQYGQTKPGLNLDQIRQLRVPVAPLAKQYEFRDRLHAAYDIRRDQLRSLLDFDRLFVAVQARAFRGEL